MLFKDRHDAGLQLLPQLNRYEGKKDVIVLGLARGGMVVAYEVAKGLGVPLNVIVVRKIGAPGNEELAIGAIAEVGGGIFNVSVLEAFGVSPDDLKEEVARQKEILKERLALYRGKSPAPNLKGKTVILVDDGIATGASMRVAIRSVRESGAKKIVLAVPVAAPDSLRTIAKEVDEVVCLSSPVFFEAVGSFYRVFDQTSDEEVIRLMS
jgi:putative phosphoribosyl transferase